MVKYREVATKLIWNCSSFVFFKKGVINFHIPYANKSKSETREVKKVVRGEFGIKCV